MIEQDTIKLLRECDSGIKMGVSAIDEVLKYVHDEELKKYLQDSLAENEKIKNDLQKLLIEYHDDGKDPNPMAKSMSWLKTNVKLAVNESDDVVADIITDGCNMGVKTLFSFLAAALIVHSGAFSDIAFNRSRFSCITLRFSCIVR